MRVLVVGSGGREHALAHAIARSPLVDEVICAPGSDGMRGVARLVPVDIADLDAIVRIALGIDDATTRADLVVVGPEDPLAAGLADRLTEAGVTVFGPSALAARLESSKSFSKAFMQRHGVPTAAYRVFDDASAAEAYVEQRGGPCVVKADGLTAGKGVTMCPDPAAARAAIGEIMRDRRFGSAGGSIVIEDWLRGPEVSYYVASDGERFERLGSAQDFKRALDGDRGENTGGMGAYSPVPFVDAALERKILDRVVRPTLEGMRAEGHPYCGVLYVGLMICDGEPFVIEFNSRFGDPETQALLFRMKSDLVPILLASAQGKLSEGGESIEFGDPTVCVCVASEGYPRAYPKGVPIERLDEVAALADTVVFHAGTRWADDRWLTNGGRVVAVTARGATIALARERAYVAAQRIAWPGAQFRSDVAAKYG